VGSQRVTASTMARPIGATLDNSFKSNNML
jgi:hypothetical protein